MSSSRRLIGYDVREDFDSVAREWTDERKARFLIRGDVMAPLSVDTDVWRSIFDVQPSMERPAWTGYVQDAWSDLDALLAALAPRDGRRIVEGHVAVLELVERGCTEPELVRWHERVLRVSPPTDGLSLDFLGYDVADWFLLSGLMNCALDQSLPSLWIARLNGYHLFETSEDADDFRRLVNRLVPEHAPFFVYGLSLVRPS